MRLAVVTTLALAALCGSASAAAWSSFGKKSPAAPRKAQAATCMDALTQAYNCITPYDGYHDGGNAARAACCGLVDQLAICASSGTTLFDEVLGILQQTQTGSLDYVMAGMDLIGNCPRTGTDDATCLSKIATANSCSQPSGPDSPGGGLSCCGAINDELQYCVGLTVGTADSNGGNSNGFWQGFQNNIDVTTCLPFTEDMCGAAASAYNTCIWAVSLGSNPHYTQNADCCQWAQWFDMFCMNRPTEVWNALAPSEEIRTAMSTQCQDHNHGGSQSGSYHGGTGSYSGPYCPWNDVIPGLQWYWNQGAGSGFVVTSNYMDGDGSFIYQDGMGVNWYRWDYNRFPNANKLFPFNMYCYGAAYGGGGGGGGMGSQGGTGTGTGSQGGMP